MPGNYRKNRINESVAREVADIIREVKEQASITPDDSAIIASPYFRATPRKTNPRTPPKSVASPTPSAVSITKVIKISNVKCAIVIL